MLPDPIKAHFAAQAEACRTMGSPFTARLLELVAEALPESAFAARIAGWAGDPRDDALALRVAGGLNALAMSGRVPAFTAAYPPADGPDAETLAAAIRAEDGFLAAFLNSAPQTNETARSAVLLGGLLHVAAKTGLEIELLEIGASVGLNLIPDRYRYELGAGRVWGDAAARPVIASDWRGAIPPLDAPLRIGGRAGVDLNPVDPALRPAPLLAYVWPDQAARVARMKAALDALAATRWRVETGDAAAWIAARLARPQAEGVARVVTHTVMWSYLPAATRAAIDASFAEAGARATMARPLGRLSVEMDAETGSAAVDLTLWPGGARRRLGRSCFHGSWAEWA